MNTELLNREDVINLLEDTHLGINKEKRVIISYIDLKGNPFAPESYGYKVSFCDELLGERHRFTFYPYTLGLQKVSSLKGIPLKG